MEVVQFMENILKDHFDADLQISHPINHFYMDAITQAIASTTVKRKPPVQ